jgi:hypothetical protein
MGKKTVTTLLLGIISFTCAYTQTGTETFPNGSRSIGLGNANVTIGDIWSIFNNSAGIAFLEHSQIAVGYDHRLNLHELTTFAAAMAIKSRQGGWGIGVSSFGSELFSQQQVGLSYASKLGITSLGLKVDYLQTSIEGGGTGRAAIVSLGGIAELTPVLFFGAHVYNLSGAGYSRLSTDKLPIIVKAGLSYRPSSALMVNLEAEKDILLPPLLKLGLEYAIAQKLYTRIGVNSDPSNLFFGIGFRPNAFQLDYAMGQHAQLGYTQHLSLLINLSKK